MTFSLDLVLDLSQSSFTPTEEACMQSKNKHVLQDYSNSLAADPEKHIGLVGVWLCLYLEI